MSTQTSTLTIEQQDKALEIVAEWLGPRMGHDGPAPTGKDAAYRAEGPMLVRDWEPFSYCDGHPHTGEPRPTIILEGGPDEWGVYASLDDEVVAKLHEIGVFGEPYNSWNLCLYPA